MSPTLNVNPTFIVIPCKFLGIMGIIDLLYCKNYHLPSNFSSIFQSSMTIFIHKLLTREGMVLANKWTHPSSTTIFVNLFIWSVIQKLTTVTLNTMFSLNLPIKHIVQPLSNTCFLLRIMCNVLGYFWA